MSNWKWHLIWAAALSVIVSALAYNTAQYNIEDAKQNAFMMKACVDAGGNWEKTWNNKFECKKPFK